MKAVRIKFICACLLFFVFITGCSSSGSSEPSFYSGSLLSSKRSLLYNYPTDKEVLSTSSLLNGMLFALIKSNNPTFNNSSPEWQSWTALMGSVTPLLQRGVASYSINYVSTDADGAPVVLSGAVFIPVKAKWDRKPFPVLVMPHPTIVERRLSPSWVLQGLGFDPMIYFAALMSSAGYVVVVPDYMGLGDNYGINPYCEQTAANSAVDIITAVSKFPLNSELGLPDLSRVAISGYSEGGYVTMATAKLMQEQEMNVLAVAPLSGPYSLSGTMRELILTVGATYPSPYFLPYILKAYEDIYGATVPLFKFENSIIAQVLPKYPDYRDTLYKSMDGSQSAEYISSLMLEVSQYIGPRSVLTPESLAAFTDINSDVVLTLAANNSYADWIPAMPMKLFHNEHDDLVPVGNLHEAVAAFNAVGVQIESEVFTEQLPLSRSVHANAMPIATLKGFLWIDAIVNPDRR